MGGVSVRIVGSRIQDGVCRGDAQGVALEINTKAKDNGPAVGGSL